MFYLSLSFIGVSRAGDKFKPCMWYTSTLPERHCYPLVFVTLKFSVISLLATVIEADFKMGSKDPPPWSFSLLCGPFSIVSYL